MPTTNVLQQPTQASAPVPGNPLLAGASAPKLDMRVLGRTGLNQVGGFVNEAPLDELRGKRALEIYREMGDTDSTCATLLYAIERLIRKVPWRVAAASTSDFDIEAAEFLETCMGDMEDGWHDFIAEQMRGMLQYGFALTEITYKRRAGDSPEGHLNSQYADGRIGWRCLSSRAQETIYRWIFDDHGRLLGCEQMAPPFYKLTYLPIGKCILFRTAIEKGNPQGVSILRGAFKSYYIKKGLESLEAVGAERDLCGIPIAWIPLEVVQAAEEKDPASMAIVESYYKLATNIRQDAQQGIVMPLAYDDKGNKMFDLTLLGSAGSKQYDADKIIRRHVDAILRSVMGDFLALGGSSGGAGSWAMHDDKTKLFLMALASFLDSFVEALNKQAVAPLLKLNGFEMSAAPSIEAGSLDKVDASQLADTLLKLSQAGMTLFPDPDLEKIVREAAGLPEAVDHAEDVSDITPQPGLADGPQHELHDPPAVVPAPEARHQAEMAAAATTQTPQRKEMPWTASPN